MIEQSRSMMEDLLRHHNALIDHCHRDQLEEAGTHECGSNPFLNVVQWHLVGIMFIALNTSVFLSNLFVARARKSDFDTFPFLLSSMRGPLRLSKLATTSCTTLLDIACHHIYA